MSESTGKPRARKPDRPNKPYPGFPLTPHASGAWQKKINGRIHYFGRWARQVNGKLERIEGDGWKDALEHYKVQADDLHAGRTPRVTGDGLTVAGLCDKFRTAKLRKLEAGEIGKRTFAEYEAIGWEIVRAFGKGRLVDDIAADDFETLRATMTEKWGPVRLCNAITRVKSVFKYGTDNGLIERAVRFGSEFKKPGKSVLRRHRAANGEKMLEAADLRKLIDAADVPLRAMILLGLNCGLGNGDCAALPLSAVDLERGWLNYPRPKTGIARRCPLWSQTVTAIREAIAARPASADFSTCGLAFVNARGLAFVRETPKSHTDLISVQFGRLLEGQGLQMAGVSFYVLRHIFRTVADVARDPVATDIIMGHTDASMGGQYVERVDDERLRAVVRVVRDWLEGGAA